jgi:hypothetical protein
MCLDVAISLTAYFVGKYTSPEMAKDVLFLVASLQPIVLAVIVSITVQNVEGIRAGK